jgi:hypothetical protein
MLGRTEMHSAELLVNEPCSFQVQTASDLFESYKSPGIDQILAELSQAGGKNYLRTTTY